MIKRATAYLKRKSFPVLVEIDEDGFFIVECPVFEGCFSQGKTLDEALSNIREVIEICAEEKENREILTTYKPQKFSLHSVSF
ncbi:MAG: type II toxin-antitoxin system HicB family antitoxin [bacterium]|nr:type II toxin-antitoxin system HicB family antitoxin [bacterium]